ncbi:MAG: HPr family phosphocarrier protein [Proteobacteria bacterium]|nr:HPr family phosphocarrier protein [Pseudomonadota bacterium]
MSDHDTGCQDCPPAPVIEGALQRNLPVINRKGLHARASAKFVQCCESFDADVKVTHCGETVGGTSIMGLLTLAAGQGRTITVSATGAQAKEALDAIEALLADRFGEGE